jgi:ribosomal protein L30/L7E
MRFIEVEQTGSPIRRDHSQRETLVGLGLNHIGRVSWVPGSAARAVLLQKSTREGFGLTVTEAMWKGTAVIGGNVGGIRRQIRDGERFSSGYDQPGGRTDCADPQISAPAPAPWSARGRDGA